MERPPAPPEAALIRIARQAANIRMAQAAEEAGVSLARWSHIENAYETRQGTTRPVKAKADTLARMARAIGLSPERLESEGQRPDAAEILREILRTPPEPPAPERRLEAVPGPLTLPDDPTDDEVEDFILDQESPYLRRILMRTWRTESIPRGVRVASVRAVAEAEASRPAEARERRREPGA